MNTALKHWKEAATVILAAGTGVRAATVRPVLPTQGVKGAVPADCAFDYKVLLLKRSGSSGFMPNAYVFPGGLLDPSDFSSGWLEVFKPCMRAPHFGLLPTRQPLGTRPPVFATDRRALGSLVPGEVAFRICALRETFEESGILLVVGQEGEGEDEEGTPVARVCDEQELASWRRRVIEDPQNFMRLCERLRCMPNIWALQEWGNWLTPTGTYARQRRYDTAFFICCLRDIPHTLQDQKEIVQYKWSSPAEILHSFQARDLWIAPPQLYDLGRMCHFPLLHDLHRFTRERAPEGCEPWLPVRLVAQDCSITLLPGDALYPTDVDWWDGTDLGLHTEETAEQLQQGNVPMHRIVHHDPYTASLHVTIAPKYKHLVPLSLALPEPASASPNHRSQL